MDKRSNLRQHFQTEANTAQSDKQYQQRTAQLNDLEETLVNAFNTLIRFMDGKTTKTEVVNQLKSISTPDVDKVVTALSKLDADILANKLDLKPVTDGLNGLKRELSLIPKSHPKIPEQKDSVKVTNLAEIKLDTSAVEKAIKALKLDVKVDAPIINTEKTDIKPLQDLMLDLLKAINKQKPTVIPKFPDIPKTDLSKVETKLDKSNKLLKEITEKRFGGGGGGGGNGTPYIDATGKAVNVTLNPDGSIPVTSSGGGAVTNDGTFATPAKQDTGNTSLSTIAAKDFATQTTLALIKAKTDNLDVALSTRAVTGLTDTQLRATPVPVSVTGGGDASAANQTTEITRLTSIRDQQTDGSQIVGIDNTKSVLYYAQVLTATTTLTPTSGKKIKLVKMQVLQNPDNSSANQVTLGFVSTGNFFIGWVGSDNAEVTGATNEVLNITLANAQPVSVLIRYKEIA